MRGPQPSHTQDGRRGTTIRFRVRRSSRCYTPIGLPLEVTFLHTLENVVSVQSIFSQHASDASDARSAYSPPPAPAAPPALAVMAISFVVNDYEECEQAGDVAATAQQHKQAIAASHNATEDVTLYAHNSGPLTRERKRKSERPLAKK